MSPDGAVATTATLRLGVIGVGRIGRMHAELLARQVPGASVSRVYDAHEPVARGVGEALGVPVASGLDEVLGADDVDAVAICTSTDTHADVIVAAAEAPPGTRQTTTAIATMIRMLRMCLPRSGPTNARIAAAGSP